MTTEVNQKLVTDSKSCSLLLHLIYIFWCHIEQKREMTGYEHSWAETATQAHFLKITFEQGVATVRCMDAILIKYNENPNMLRSNI